MNENLQPLVSIVVLNFNAKDFLIKCIDSIFQSQYKDFEVILVDNASEDDTYKICKENHPEINLIINQENLGYCGGNNVGIKNATGEFIIILNPDTLVDPNWINEFLKANKENGDGIYQPKIISLEDKKTILSTGNMIHLFGFGFARDKGNLKTRHIENVERITYSSGTCIFTTKKLFEKIGMFDSFLFLYHDDLDLSWRASMQKIDSFYVPTITVFHKESYNFQWSSKKFYWLERNRKYCILTHYSKETQKKIASELFLSDVLVWISYFFKGFLLVKIKAELEIRKNKNKIEEKYLELEKIKLVSDEEMIKKFSDEIWIPKDVSNNFFNKLFNLTLKKLSINARKKLK